MKKTNRFAAATKRVIERDRTEEKKNRAEVKLSNIQFQIREIMKGYGDVLGKKGIRHLRAAWESVCKADAAIYIKK